MKLSCCLVLKDEAKTIYKCLNSLKSFVDEFIIGIDDTTTDHTADEVMRFFAEDQTRNYTINEKDGDVQIYEYKWDESFSKARNQGMDRATGDYILIMDGHEYVPEKWYNLTEKKDMPCIEIVPKILEKVQQEKPDEVFFMLYQQPFVGQIPNNYFMQPRIYRNGKGKDGKKIRFGRAAHNVIRGTDPDKSMHFPELIILHDAPSDNRAVRAKQRAEMNVKQLKEDLKKNPKDSRALFYLGNTLMEITDYEEAAKSFEKYIKLDRPNTSEKYQVYFHLGICYKELKKPRKAMDSFYSSVRINPMRRDAYILIGDLFMDDKNYDMALYNYNSALLIEPECSRMFHNGATHTWMPYQRAALAYKEVGNTTKAIAYMRRAQRYVQCKEWDEFIEECRGGKQKRNILFIDKIGSFTKPFIDHFKKKYNVVVVKRFDRYLAEWADYIWQEWGDENIAENTVPHKTIVRIHGYEAYMNMGLLSSIPWEEFKAVIFVAQHIRDMVNLPSLNGQVNVIQNGVDTESFYIKNPNRDPKAIGLAGLLNVKKNPMRLAKIIKSNPGYIFHLRVEWQDKFLEKSFEYETKDCKNIVYHGRYDNLADFWNQMSYVISTSDIESFSFNIAEAMSCGCHPLVYPWKGADAIWPKDSMLDGDIINPSGLRSRIEEREYIQENYPLSRTIERMEEELLK